MVKLTRAFVALGLVAAIAAVGPPVTAQAQGNTAYNEAVTAVPITIENITVVVQTSAGLDTIGVVTIELLVVEKSPIPAVQIAEAPEPPDTVTRDIAVVHASTYASARPSASQSNMTNEPAPTARDALWRSSMTASVTPRTNPSPLIATSSTREQDTLLHLNL